MNREAWSRGLGIAGNPNYWKGARHQLKETLSPRRGPIASPEKSPLAIVPGWTCSDETYHRLGGVLSLNYNVLPTEQLPRKKEALLSRQGLETQSETLLNTLFQAGEKHTNLVGHSNGGLVAVLAKIKAEASGVRDLIGSIVTLSAPMSGSAPISQLPIVSRYSQAIRDLHPESSVMQRVQQEGQTNHRVVAETDELFTAAEMNFHNGEEHRVSHGHFDYFVGEKATITNTAKLINQCLQNERSTILQMTASSPDGDPLRKLHILTEKVGRHTFCTTRLGPAQNKKPELISSEGGCPKLDPETGACQQSVVPNGPYKTPPNRKIYCPTQEISIARKMAEGRRN